MFALRRISKHNNDVAKLQMKIYSSIQIKKVANIFPSKLYPLGIYAMGEMRTLSKSFLHHAITSPRSFSSVLSASAIFKIQRFSFSFISSAVGAIRVYVVDSYVKKKQQKQQ